AHDQGPAVVSILTKSTRTQRTIADFFGFQDPQGGGNGANRRRGLQQPEVVPVEGAGSGFIIDKAGFILTNNHVVEDATEIEVKLQGMEDLAQGLPAKVIGRDVLTDSALIQLTELPKEPLTAIKLGDSSQIEPGDWVMAIGNPFRLGHSVTVGVISGLGRPFGGVVGREQNMLQTDAAINPGNSGGPLLNIRGEVVGMNTAIYTDRSEANIGIGFATPINVVRDLIPQLRQGKVVRGVIGVQVSKDKLTAETAKAFGLPNTNGALVSTVNPKGPADRAGLQPGDVIVEYNGKPVKDSDVLVADVVNTKPGTTVPVTYYRTNQKKTASVTIDELDLDAEQGRAAARNTPQTAPEQQTSTALGMTLDAITPEIARRLDLPRNAGGAIISDVEPNSPAYVAGLAPGDVILEVNRQQVTNVSQITRELQNVAPGQPVFLLIWRDGTTTFVTVTKR
ncbi:MAG TPA: PDZ domain-containing protein, partial [Vicinamibacterales bacterium]|nr:PDZ domain-containing protein [Vicinamibacterales bacterium]